MNARTEAIEAAKNNIQAVKDDMAGRRNNATASDWDDYEVRLAVAEEVLDETSKAGESGW